MEQRGLDLAKLAFEDGGALEDQIVVLRPVVLRGSSTCVLLNSRHESHEEKKNTRQARGDQSP